MSELKLIFAPTVYLVGRTSPLTPDLDRYVENCGGSVESLLRQAVSGPELLCEVAGRTCYQSFANSRPGGNAAYLANILEHGHGSIAEHAVYSFVFTGVSRSLTHELIRHRAGWSYCLAGDVSVWSGSKLNGIYDGIKKRWSIRKLFEWSNDPIRKGRLKLIKVRCFDGESFVQAGVKSVVCSGIKTIKKVTLEDGKTIRCSENHLFLTPDGWEPARQLRAGTPLATNGLPAVNLDREWLMRQYHENKRRIKDIALEVGCSPHTVRKYISLYGLQKPLGAWSIGQSPPNKGTTCRTGYHHPEATKKILSEQKRGSNGPSWKGDNASQQAGRLRAQRMYPSQPCEACGMEDGHRHHKDRNTLNNNRDNIEFLCGRCHKLRHIKEDGHSSWLTVKWVPVKSIESDGEEMTYDLEVDHPAHNFVANGFVTHNSELSQRFADCSDVAFVVPPAMLETVQRWKHNQIVPEQCLDQSSQEQIRKGQRWIDDLWHHLGNYVYLSGDLSQQAPPEFSSTDRRKFGRQAARSVLPECAETKLFATVNARALRHFVELRGTMHADAEIRRLAVAVVRIMQAEAPGLFGDYVISDTQEEHVLPTKWRKV